MHRQFLPLSLERIFRTSAFQAQCFLEKAAFAPSSFGVFHDRYPCVTALLLICSKLAPTSARPSHGMTSREESGRLGDHVWLTGKALDKIWRPRRDLNPCYRRERATP